MKVKLNKGKNLPGKSGQVEPHNAGAVVDVPDRLARQLVAAGAAVIVTQVPKVAGSSAEVQNADSAKTSKMSER